MMIGKNIDLNSFIDWQAEDVKNRLVHPTIEGNKEGEQIIKVWVYDYKLQTGQFVKSVEEIDLVKQKRRDDKRKFEELKRELGEQEE